MELLLDADATVAMRGLGLLPHLLATSAGVAFTGYIYEHELRSPKDLEAHRTTGRIGLHHVLVRTPAHERRRALLDVEHLDKGEAEAIAWLLDDPTRAETIAFVTLDVRARKVARGHGLEVMDIAEVAAALVIAKLIPLDTVRTHLCAWDDRRNQSGRPKKWGTFDADFPRVVADMRARR